MYILIIVAEINILNEILQHFWFYFSDEKDFVN